MKILVTIPHFFKRISQNAKYTSQRDPLPRLNALNTLIQTLHQNFGRRQLMNEIEKKIAIPANKSSQNVLDIIICHTRNDHLIDSVFLPRNFYQNYSTDVNPMFLGFECHRILAENLGKYDYYCYLEDDLIIRDTNFFTKLNWFNQLTDKIQLLQPNRYELTLNQYVDKCYIDGSISLNHTKEYQNTKENSQLKGRIFNQTVTFNRSSNPHSGCFFLTNEQMKYWVDQEYFLDKDDSFVGPLESAATLGIMKTFQIYKTSSDYANFLEIQHWGSGYACLLGSVIKVNGMKKL